MISYFVVAGIKCCVGLHTCQWLPGLCLCIDSSLLSGPLALLLPLSVSTFWMFSLADLVVASPSPGRICLE